MYLSSKNTKKHKNTKSNKIKNKYSEALVSWDFKPYVGNLNFSKTLGR